MLGEHLLGIYEKAFDPDASWAYRAQTAGELGFDFIELSIDEQDSRIERLYWPTIRKRELAGICSDRGTPLMSMCLSAHRRYPFGSADEGLRARSMDILKRAVEFAAETGIRLIQLAAYDVYYEPSTDESRKRYIEMLAEAVKFAESHCVMLANETMDTEFVNSVSRHLEYQRLLESPWFKVYPDMGNLSAWELDVSRELRLGRGSIVQVHVKDTRPVHGKGGAQFKNVPFGEGCVDFVKCFSTLEAQEYRGPYLIEMWHNREQNDRSAIAAARDFVRACYDRAADAQGGE